MSSLSFPLIICRECLGRVLREKMGSDKMDGKNYQEVEEYVKSLLDNEVKSLWPKGWMQLRYAKPEFSTFLHVHLWKEFFFFFSGC